MSVRLAGIRACVFDAYGTLFDVGSAAASCADRLGADRAAALARLWRDKQLQYTWLRSIQRAYVDFGQITADSLDFALESLGIDDAALRATLLRRYTLLDAFPDAAAALARLKARGFRSAILSNGAPAMLATMIDHAGFGGDLDAVLSVDSVRIYKPAAEVYRLATDHFGVPASRICFVSSNGWDAYAASAFGMRVVWCNRASQPAERLPGAPDLVITSLDALPDLLDSEA